MITLHIRFCYTYFVLHSGVVCPILQVCFGLEYNCLVWNSNFLLICCLKNRIVPSPIVIILDINVLKD